MASDKTSSILDRWAELERAATAGPWQAEMVDGGRDVDGAPFDVPAILTTPSGADDDGGDVVAGCYCNPTEADAALIVFLRNHSAELREVMLEVVSAAAMVSDGMKTRDEAQAGIEAAFEAGEAWECKQDLPAATESIRIGSARLRAALERLGVR